MSTRRDGRSRLPRHLRSTPPTREYLVEVIGNGWGHTMTTSDPGEVHAACRELAAQYPDRWIRARLTGNNSAPMPPLYDDANGEPLGIVCLLEPSATLPREDGDPVEPAPDQDALFG